jgi:endonuclease/exonuclease/phosphatase (EEP) superfamily protein YafD
MSSNVHTGWCLSHSMDPHTSEAYVCNCGADSASLDEIQRAIEWLGTNTRLRGASTAELLAKYATEKNAEIIRLREVLQEISA